MSNFVPSGGLTLSDALDRVASVLHIQKREAQQTLRQLLYSGQVPSRIIERSGQKHDTPTHVWGGMQWDEALKSGAVCFEVAAYAPDACGRVIIPEAALKTALNSYGVTKGADEQAESGVPTVAKKTETRQRDEQISTLFKAISVANPQAKRGQIRDMMRGQRPGLFTNRREAAGDKQISDQRIDRIIREQQKQQEQLLRRFAA